MSLGLSRPTYVDDGELVLAHCVHDSQDECWPWTGAMQGQGYGQYGKPMRLAHRISYEFFVGPIPEGLTLDHLCRNRQCVNPSHLEPVTRGENVLRGESLPARNARKTHCPKGHPYDDINTYVSPNTGWRQCKACRPPRG